MAPIASSSRTKLSDNNNSDHVAPEKSSSSTGNNRVRSTLSREKASTSSSSSSAGGKKGTEEPAKKISSSSSSSARSSSSAGSSSRTQAPATKSTSATSKQPAKPETTTSSRKESSKSSAAAPASVSPSETPAATAVKAVKSHPLPSTVMNKHKQAAVFTSGKKKHKTNFGSAYDSGSIPCRINHGGIKNALQWTKAPETLDFNPLLVTCVEGFQEVEHPFVFLARTAFKDLMKAEDAGEKALAVLPQVIQPLRAALMNKDEDIFLTALEATRILSDAVEGEMNVYLPKLTQQIHRKLLTKQLRAEVEDTLATLERNGGKEALAIIRSKIPTYVSVSF